MALGGHCILLSLSLVSALCFPEPVKWWQQKGDLFTSRVTSAPIEHPHAHFSCSCLLPQFCNDTKQRPIYCGDSGKICCSNVINSPATLGVVDSTTTTRAPTTTTTHVPIHLTIPLSALGATSAPPHSTDNTLDIADFEGQQGYVDEGCGVATPHYNYDYKQSTDDDGLDSAQNEFPWTLNLLETMAGNMTKAVCAAVLVEYAMAVTAAHCVYRRPREGLIVRAGEWVVDSDIEVYPHKDSQVSKVVIAPNFYEVGLHNDIAVLILQPGFQEAPNIRPICTPKQRDKVKTPCFATGWGSRGNDISPKLQATMKKIPMKLLPVRDCEKRLQGTDLGERFRLSSSSLCALALKGDTGMGDGGGPLFCETESRPPRFSLVGITSWGKFAYPGTPGVYTLFRKFSQWAVQQYFTESSNHKP